MPSKNVVKLYEEHSFYHIYNRGVAKQTVFHDSADKKTFQAIISRHLDPDNRTKRYDGVEYKKLDKELELLCYCLMGNHFHLLLYMSDSETAVRIFMQSVMTAYTMYYNKRYKRVGSLFQGTFKASKVDNESYLLHISRYIHLNPRNYSTYFYSSCKNYLGVRPEPWLKIDKIKNLFSDTEEYTSFMSDYDDYKNGLEDLKFQLADR